MDSKKKADIPTEIARYVVGRIADERDLPYPQMEMGRSYFRNTVQTMRDRVELARSRFPAPDMLTQRAVLGSVAFDIYSQIAAEAFASDGDPTKAAENMSHTIAEVASPRKICERIENYMQGKDVSGYNGTVAREAYDAVKGEFSEVLAKRKAKI